MKLAFESEDAAKQIFPYKCDWAPYNIELNHPLFDYVSWNTYTVLKMGFTLLVRFVQVFR